MMKVLVTGGRYYDDVAYLAGVLDEIHAQTPITDLMQGGASGADFHAYCWCKAQREAIFRWSCEPPFHAIGGAAGPMRNARMLKMFRPDLVVAFPGNRGTKGMVELAKDAGVTVAEHTANRDGKD